MPLVPVRATPRYRPSGSSAAVGTIAKKGAGPKPAPFVQPLPAPYQITLKPSWIERGLTLACVDCVCGMMLPKFGSVAELFTFASM